MPRYFQTWSLPESNKFDYICFYAKSTKQAKKIATPWLIEKARWCRNTQDLVEGNMGFLICYSRRREVVYKFGVQFLDWQTGRISYLKFCVKFDP